MRMAHTRQVGVAATELEAEVEALAGKARTSDERRYNANNQQQQQQHVSILEVLTDRYGPRAGRWAAFTVEKGVRLISIS